MSGLSFAASALLHLAVILALLPQRCSLPAATPPISVDLVRLDTPPDGLASTAEADPVPPASDAADQIPASADPTTASSTAPAAGTTEPPPDSAGQAPASKPAMAGWVPPFSVGQSPLSDAAEPSEVDKPPPPPGGEAAAAGSERPAQPGLPFQVLTSKSDDAATLPAPIEPASDTGRQAEAQPVSEEVFAQRLNDYGEMLNGRMRWQLTGKLPGVTPFTIVVTIELDGTISSAAVTQSTGVKDVDRQALQRVLALSPLPPPPIRLENLRLQGRAFPQR